MTEPGDSDPPVRVLLFTPAGRSGQSGSSGVDIDAVRATLESAPAVSVAVAGDEAALRASLAENGVDLAVVPYGEAESTAVGPLRTLRSVDAGLPMLAVATPARAGEAITAGGTDVLTVTDRGPDERVLVNRVRRLARSDPDASAGRPAPGEASATETVSGEPRADDAVLFRRINEVMSDLDHSFEERVERLLDLSVDRLGMDAGFLSRIDEDAGEFEILVATGDHDRIAAGVETDLSNTYCRRALADDREGPHAIRSALDEGMADDPAYETFGLGCYLGTEIHVGGELYGTLCFVGDEPRDRPFSEGEQALIDVTGQWLRTELERRDYRETVERTRDRMEATLERLSEAFFAVDEDWRISYVNEAGAAVLRRAMEADYDSDELLDKHLWDEIPEAVDTTFYEKYTEAVDHQEPVFFEEYYPPLDVWFEVRAYPDENGLSVYFSDITERKQREQELERYVTATQTISDAIITVDEAGVVQSVNPAIESVLGYGPGDLVGDPITTIMPDRFVDGHRAAFEQYVRTGERTLDWDYIELPGRHADGHEVPLAISFSEYEHEGRRFFTGVLRDITERKEREQALNDLLDATRQFIAAGDRAELLDTIVEATEQTFDLDLSLIRLHDPDSGTLPCARISTSAEQVVPDPPLYDADDGLVGEVFQSGEPVLVDDIAAETPYDYGDVKAAMVFPLGDHGTFGIGSLTEGAFDGEDVALVELLTATATSALDRLETEREMRNLHRVIDHVDEKALLVDADGEFAFVTDPLASYLGYDRAALADGALADHVSDWDRERYGVMLSEVADLPPEESRTLELDLRTADGDTRPVELALSRTSGGGETEIAGVVTDISDLEAARTTLEIERGRFQKLFESLQDPVVEVRFEDGVPVVEYVNPAFTDVFGYDGDAVAGENLNDLVVPEGVRGDARDLDERALAGERTTVEVERETTTGRRDFLLRGITYAREDGVYGFGVYTDITEQKERGRYLKVINRVLRHNLRNDLSVVFSLSHQLSTTVEDDSLAESARLLFETAQDISAMSEKARQIESLLSRERGATGEIDAVDCVETVREAFESEYPDAEITVDLPERLPVAATYDLRKAIEELVENAIEHSESATPTVHIDGGPADRDGWVTLAVADDGPGLPDDEWEIITGEEQITQLSHGSGLGLWLARWVVESFGGRFTDCDTGAGGTRIEMALPAADFECADADARPDAG